MPKKIISTIFLCLLILNTPAYAVNDKQLCFAEDLMKEAIKESLETVGKHLLNKYLNNVNNVNIQQNTTTQNTTTNSTVTTPVNTPSVTPATATATPTPTIDTTTSASTVNHEEEVTIID